MAEFTLNEEKIKKKKMKRKKIYNFNFLEILDHRLPKLSFCYCKTPRRMKDNVRNLMLVSKLLSAPSFHRYTN